MFNSTILPTVINSYCEENGDVTRDNLDVTSSGMEKLSGKKVNDVEGVKKEAISETMRRTYKYFHDRGMSLV